MLNFIGTRLFGMLAGGASIALLIALISLFVANSATMKELRRTNTQLEDNLKQCARDNLVLKSNNGALEAAVAQQNANVAAAAAQAAQRDADAAEARTQANLRVQQANARVAALAKAKAGSNPCADADKLILEAVQ